MMDLIVKANKKVYEEARDMCEAIRELFADELAEYIRQGQEHEKQIQEYERREQKSAEQLNQMSISLENATNQGISALVEVCIEAGMGRDVAEKKLVEKFNLAPKAAKEYVKKLWKTSV